jgi:hypothetical protein
VCYPNWICTKFVNHWLCEITEQVANKKEKSGDWKAIFSELKETSSSLT